MSGKASILLVLGFSLIFMIIGRNFGSLSTRAVENFADYYTTTRVHNIAVSAANLAANQIFLNQNWTTGFDNIEFNGGRMSASVQVVDAFKDIRKLTATGTFGQDTKTIEVYFQPSKFSKFAYFSKIEGNIWWTTKDTVWGPMHIQDWLKVSGNPVFMGKVTVKKDIWYYSRGGRYDDPEFHGGFEKGVNLPLPDNKVKSLGPIAQSGGAYFNHKTNVYINFVGDSIKYKFSSRGHETTVLASDFAPNGMIYVNNGNARISGVVKGRYSVVAYGPSSGLGRVYIDDDIVYSDDPRTNPNSTDMLGIIARNEVLITNNENNLGDVNIQASIYSEKEGFGAEDYRWRPPGGNINLYGGIVQKKRQPVGTFNARTHRVVSGFSKRYRYDDRFMLASPPYFPGTGHLEIISWYE